MRALTTMLGATLLLGCDESPYQTPGPDTRPSVELEYPELYKRLYGAGNLEPVKFRSNSTDLTLLVIPQVEGEPPRTLDFAYPARKTLVGYGAYAGLYETYRRSPMVDDNGIHAIRTAVYRSDRAGNHTNAWYTYWAKSTEGVIYLTQMAQWRWQQGEVEVTEFPLRAWPLFRDLQPTHVFGDGPFGIHPGIFNSEGLDRQVFLSTDATSPTAGIEACVLYLHNSDEEARQYLAYVHEVFGVVEVVYRWEFFGNDGILPIDGFALLEGSVEEPTPAVDVPTILGGTWIGEGEATEIEIGDDTMPAEGVDAEPWSFELSERACRKCFTGVDNQCQHSSDGSSDSSE